MLDRIIIVVSIVALSIVLLSVRVILKKNGRFSSQHISQSKAMRDRRINCVNTQDWNDRHKEDKRLDINSL